MLEIRGATYRYAGSARPALRHVDLTLRDGEIVGIVGANDAGKTTLCLVASGLAPGSIGGSLGGGSLAVDGRIVRDRPLHELAGVIAIGFQDSASQLSGVTGTVFEEVALGPMNLGLPVHETVGRTRAALATLCIDDLAERRPSGLSGGQAQLVVLASLLAMHPRHLVLDEPTAQLDPEGARLVGSAIARLASQGTSLLVAEHRTDLLDAICTRVVVLEEGRIVTDGPAREILADLRLPGWGVEPPSRVRLATALSAAGLESEEMDSALGAAS